MALTPTIVLCVQSGCTELTFSETTGAYDSVTNTGGYGSPNINIADVANAVLRITSPDDTICDIDVKDLSDFPTTNEDFEYSIDLADLEDRTSIEDGYWQFSYRVTDGASTLYEGTKAYFFYCNSNCCVERLLAGIEVDECMCSESTSKKIENYTLARTMLQSLKAASSCSNVTNFNKIKTLLAKLCRSTGCKTC